ncbi:MAG: hypothetical protein R2758_11135 [Bacteroidales bacterium]
MDLVSKYSRRCAPANALMVLVLLSVLLYWKAVPVASFLVNTRYRSGCHKGHSGLPALIAIGFFIYGPVALIGAYRR